MEKERCQSQSGATPRREPPRGPASGKKSRSRKGESEGAFPLPCASPAATFLSPGEKFLPLFPTAPRTPPAQAAFCALFRTLPFWLLFCNTSDFSCDIRLLFHFISSAALTVFRLWAKSGEKWHKVERAMVFRGRFSRNLDQKGRLTLPPELRAAFPAEGAAGADASGSSSCAFVLTTYDGCLVAFSWKDWTELEEKFMRIPNPSPRVRAFRRLVIGGAERHVPDAQGRILLSPDHRAYAALEKEATILGLVDRFEIWNPAALRASMAPENLEGVTEELAASGIDFSL